MTLKMKVKEDDIVLCTVTRIVATTVFLNIEGNGEGSMTVSEVSPGRIRNLREYVAPNKKVVCKVLRITPKNIELSLRRVTAKEREEVTDRYKKERMLENMLKPVFKEKTPALLEKIKDKYDLSDFLDEVRENPELLNKFVSSSEAESLAKIFAEKKEKEKEVRQTLKIHSNNSSGILDIKSTLSIPKKEGEIRYKGSSKFSISVKASTYKNANTKMEDLIETLKEKAKKHNVLLEVKGK